MTQDIDSQKARYADMVERRGGTPDPLLTKQTLYIRLPADLYEWVRAEAARQYRSMTSLVTVIIAEAKERA